MVPPELEPLVIDFEGFHRVVRRRPEITAVPYICPAGFWTRGYGELCRQDAGEITEPQARQRLREVLLPFYTAEALRLSPRLLLEPSRRLAAIADFVFNLGAGRYSASTLRRKVNAEDWTGAGVEIRRWVFAGPVKLPGLVLRREVEAGLLG